MPNKLIVTSCLIISCAKVPPLWADLVRLNNGNHLEGIVIQETEQALQLEVFFDAKITFSKQDIAYVKKWSAEQNQQLRRKWLKEKQEREDAELLRQEFEIQQRQKGLVKYRDQWIPQRKKEQLETREYVDEILKGKIEQGEITRGGGTRTEIARALLAKVNWRHRQTKHFVIYYEDTLQSKIVADNSEYFYEKIIYDLNYEKEIYWPNKCEVFIISSREKWNEYMQPFLQQFDHFGGFVPASREKEIYLCALSLPYLAISFPHELTHLIFREFAQDKYIPLWLNEGLAIYESGVSGYRDELLQEKVKNAEHIILKELLEMRSYPQTEEAVRLFYAQVGRVVGLLITQHGRRRFSDFCRYLLADKSFNQALDLVYGDKYYNFNEFKRAWIKYVLQ